MDKWRVYIRAVMNVRFLMPVGYLVMIDKLEHRPSSRIEREKLYPGTGLEPGPLALRASALTTTLSGTSDDA